MFREERGFFPDFYVYVLSGLEEVIIQEEAFEDTISALYAENHGDGSNDHSGGSRLQRTEYGQICPRRKIFRQKALIFSDFCCTFAMSLMILLVLICSTKVSEKSDMAKS